MHGTHRVINLMNDKSMINIILQMTNYIMVQSQTKNLNHFERNNHMLCNWRMNCAPMMRYMPSEAVILCRVLYAYKICSCENNKHLWNMKINKKSEKDHTLLKKYGLNEVGLNKIWRKKTSQSPPPNNLCVKVICFEQKKGNNSTCSYYKKTYWNMWQL